MSESSFDLREQVLRMSGVNPAKCMCCGKCSATCPAYGEMEYHPHEFVALIERGDIARLIASPSFTKCLSCFACVDRCPRGVEPAKLVEAIRLLSERAQGGDRFTPRDLPPLAAAAASAGEDLPQQAVVSAFRKYRK